MPLAIDADWEAAKLLYLKGLQTPTIAAQIGVAVGTLRQRIKRCGWVQLRNDTQSKLNSIAVDCSVNALERSGQRARNKVATLAEKLVDGLSERQIPSNLDKLQQTAEVLSTTTKTLAIAHGWENTTINAIVMAGDTTDAIESLCAEPIDVDSLPSQPE